MAQPVEIWLDWQAVLVEAVVPLVHLAQEMAVQVFLGKEMRVVLGTFPLQTKLLAEVAVRGLLV